MLIGFLIIIILIILDFVKKLRVNNYFFKNGIKGTKISFPLIGDAWLTFGNDIANIFNLLHYMGNAYGKVCRLWIFQDLYVIIQDYKYLEPILRSSRVIRKNFVYDMLRDWLNDGLLISSGHKWHARRKAITPSFHFSILEQFIEIFDQQSHALVRRLQRKADGVTVIDMCPEVCLTTLDVIIESAMGVKINVQKNYDSAYVQALNKVANIIATRMNKPIYHYKLFYLMSHFRENITLSRNIKLMHTFTESIISERRKTLNSSCYNLDINHMNQMPPKKRQTNKKRAAFLDLLLQTTIDGKMLTNLDIREEVDTFMFEGHDTVSSAICFCCYLLARHPKAQDKLITELCDVLGNDQSEGITLSKLQDMKYLECVIKETLRLYPSVPIISRVIEENFQIGNVILPAGTNLVLPLYTMSRDPEVFPQPLDFIPDRFLLDSNNKISPYAYVPFSAGPRNCIGQKFAMLEMKCIISRLVYHYKILPLGPEVELVMSLILRSATGINVGLMPRSMHMNAYK